MFETQNLQNVLMEHIAQFVIIGQTNIAHCSYNVMEFYLHCGNQSMQ